MARRLVAVVDDHEEVAALIAALIEMGEDFDEVDVRVIIAGEGAFEHEEWKGVDVALIDMNMPVSGDQVLAFLRAEFPLIRRVAMSVIDFERFEPERLVDADLFLKKPFDRGAFCEAVFGP